jgi:hypothetical protein
MELAVQGVFYFLCTYSGDEDKTVVTFTGFLPVQACFSFLIFFFRSYSRYALHPSASELAKQSFVPNPGTKGFPLLSGLMRQGRHYFYL